MIDRMRIRLKYPSSTEPVVHGLVWFEKGIPSRMAKLEYFDEISRRWVAVPIVEDETL